MEEEKKENREEIKVEEKEEIQEDIIQEKKNLKEELEETKKTFEETKNKMLRIAADFENYKKRVEKEKIEYLKFANEKLLREFLPVLDNLERAINFPFTTENLEKIKEGFELIMNDFKNLLSRFGIEGFDSKGNKFDPSIHDALQCVETDEYEDGYIIDEISRGYFYNQKLLRPARVVIAKKPPDTIPEIKIQTEEDIQ